MVSKKSNNLFVNKIDNLPNKKFDRLNRRLQKKLINVPDKKIEKTASRLYMEELNKIDQLNENGNRRQDLHKIRIHTRKAKELAIIMSTSGIAMIPKKVGRRTKSLYEKLGIWHDQEVLLDSLKSTRRKADLGKKNKKLTQFIEQTSKKEKKLRKDLGRQISIQIKSLMKNTSKAKRFESI